MIKRYVYKGTVYRTANALRKAVWHSEHKVCDREPEENKIEFWKKTRSCIYGGARTGTVPKSSYDESSYDERESRA